MNSIDIDSHNLCLLNFFDIFTECENKILDDLYKFDLLEGLSYQNIDTKKIIYYHVILTLCEAILHKMTFNKIIVIYNENDFGDIQLCEFCGKFRTISFITNTLNKLKKILPIRLYTSDISFTQIGQVLELHDGDRVELISRLQLSLDSKVDSFQKAKTFAKRYELTFLSENFFHRVKVKNLMFL